MYLTLVKLSRGFFWAALVAGFLGLLLPKYVPLWLSLGLAVACGFCVLQAVLHARRTRRHGLRCPNCGWVPFAISAWKCKECRYVWDSFATGGACPRCHHQHQETACVRCRRIFANRQWGKAERT
jgi:hypothetical protein